MPRYYRRRFAKTAPRDKYSVEQKLIKGSLTALAGQDPGYQQAIIVVPASNLQGMRKVKHLTVNLTCDAEHLYWALVYVPQGTDPNPIVYSEVPGTGFYEPNQFVMNCGVVDPSAGPVRISSPISRNLNSGDSIRLILANESAVDFYGVVRYAITLQ